MKILDANAILRYLLKDMEEQASEVADAVREGAMTTPEVIAEVVYVLTGVYGLTRSDVSWYIHCTLLDIRVENVKVLRYAMSVFNLTNLDFVDCLMVAYHKVLGMDILTFDRKLNSTLEKELEIFRD